MSAIGHSPVGNFGPKRGKPRPSRAEAAVLRQNRSSLAYYRPQRRRPSIQEAAVLGAFETPAGAMENLPDAAVASFGDHMLLEAIIGNDDRVKVAPELIEINPWRQICALRIHAQSGQLYVGTGWWIGPRAIATAGHCVYMLKEGGWPASIDVIPAKAGPNEPFGRLTATRFTSVDGWTEQESRDFDYGVIFLDDDTVGRKLGNFEVQARTDGELSGVVAKISGYPADRERAEFQFFHERPLRESTPSRLTYDIDTFGGQSGSPIWEDTTDAGLIVIGIHTNGGVSSNSGTRINSDVLDNLISWAEA